MDSFKVITEPGYIGVEPNSSLAFGVFVGSYLALQSGVVGDVARNLIAQVSPRRVQPQRAEPLEAGPKSLSAKQIFDILQKKETLGAQRYIERTIFSFGEDLESVLQADGQAIDEDKLLKHVALKSVAREEDGLKKALGVVLPEARRNGESIEDLEKTVAQLKQVNQRISKDREEQSQFFAETIAAQTGRNRDKYLSGVVDAILAGKDPSSLQELYGKSLPSRGLRDILDFATPKAKVEEEADQDARPRDVARQTPKTRTPEKAEVKVESRVETPPKTTSTKATQKPPAPKKEEEQVEKPSKEKSWTILREYSTVNDVDGYVKAFAKRILQLVMIILAPITLAIKFIVCPLVDYCRQVEVIQPADEKTKIS